MNPNIPEDIAAKFHAKYESFLGAFPSKWETAPDGIYQTPDGGFQCNYVYPATGSLCAITLRPGDETPKETHGTICSRWYHEGGAWNEKGERGWLGFPISDEEAYADGGDPEDRISHFENGDIIWTKMKDETRVVKRADAVSTLGETGGGNVVQPNQAVNENAEVRANENANTLQAMEKSPELISLLKEIDAEREELARIKQEFDCGCVNQESRSVFEGIMSEIARRRSAFDSKTFFMATFGMLKAGKSTLVNAFVGKKVSPIGRAKETTLRSSIIMASDHEHKEGIYVYSPREGAKSSDDSEIAKWKQKNMAALMEFLGGIIAKDELYKSFREEIFPLDDEKLEEFLTKSHVPECPNMLPPVIRVDTSNPSAANILSGGVAIIDTPGLDGVKSDKDSDPYLQNLKSLADYYLLVQSSMSAMNSDCKELLEDIFKYTRNAPFLVVYNEIAANFWMKPEAEKKMLILDAAKAAKELADGFRQIMNGVAPDCEPINAGESADAMFGMESDMRIDKDKMLEESRIVKLRDRIMKTLREDRRAIKEGNAIDRLCQELKGVDGEDGAIAKCKKQCEKIVAAEFEVEAQEKKEWEEYKTLAGKLCNDFINKDGIGSVFATQYGIALKDSMKDKGEEFHNPWTRRVNTGGNYRENSNEVPDAEVYEGLGKLNVQFRMKFIECIEENFNIGSLRRSNMPWTMVESNVVAKEWQELNGRWQQLQKFLGEGYRLREDFPDCLLKEHDVGKLTAFANEPEFNPRPPEVYNPWWRLRCFCKTKLEYACFDAWELHRDKLKRIYFGESGETAEAVKRAQEVFVAALKEKGKKLALDVQNRINDKIRRMEEEAAQRKARVDKEKRLFDDAVACMERMQRKLNSYKNI